MQNIITQGVAYQQLLNDVRALIRHEMAQAQPTANTAQQPVADELLTVQQAAKQLDVCVATVHEWKRRGMLVYRKIGGRVYFNRADVLSAGTQEQRTVKASRTKVKTPA